jgi:hypothetical protein
MKQLTHSQALSAEVVLVATERLLSLGKRMSSQTNEDSQLRRHEHVFELFKNTCLHSHTHTNTHT